MERLQQLITRLKDQFDQKADVSQMLITAQMIESELSLASAQPQRKTNSAKVAVVMPTSVKFQLPGREEISANAQPIESSPKEIYHLEEPEVATEYAVKEEEINGYYREEEKIKRTGKSKENKLWQFDPLTEIPTLSHQQAAREINDVIGDSGLSLNERLKVHRSEVAHSLKDAPVRDLKKAIGVNDRFVFINDLFRGDEAMYERSIKTINNFRILPEAEYWMERELKVKLGWDESRDATQHFYQVVKRRFS